MKIAVQAQDFDLSSEVKGISSSTSVGAVASFVTFLIFVRPFLLRTQGVTEVEPRVIQARADFDWLEPDARREFLRVKWNAQGGLDLYPTQDSAVLTSTAWADGLLDNPAKQAIRRGDTVRYLPYAELYR